jgi:hypothetical protein
MNFCYQVQKTVVSSGAHSSSYNSVATTLYSTLVDCVGLGMYRVWKRTEFTPRKFLRIILETKRAER